MTRNSFEAPLHHVVDQYGDFEKKGSLVLLTGNTETDREGLEKAISEDNSSEGLFINFGQDNFRQDLARIRSIQSEMNIDVTEIHIPGIAASLLDTEQSYDAGTVINTIHGLAADYALYNGFKAINVLESFENTSVFSILPQYYFSINQQLNSLNNEEKIKIFGRYVGLGENSEDSIEDESNEARNFVVTMLSGGPDSSVLLSELVRQYYNRAIVEAIFINFGQPYMAQELLSARHIANICRVRLEEISVSGVSQAFVGKGESGIGYPIFRNLINGMYGIATDYARFKQANSLYHANIQEDVTNLPWMPNFFNALNKTTQSINTGKVKTEVKSDYLDIPKAEVIMRGSELIGEHVAETFSCLRSNTEGKHCGVCRSCKNRRKAFIAAEVQDTTSYDVEPDVGEVEKYESPTSYV